MAAAAPAVTVEYLDLTGDDDDDTPTTSCTSTPVSTRTDSSGCPGFHTETAKNGRYRNLKRMRRF